MSRGWVSAWALATAILAGATYYSAATVTHGFIAYYAAARLLTHGFLGPGAYDDVWFGAFLQQLTGTSIRDIFTPNPPSMALMALPVAAFEHGFARALWLSGSVVLFAAAVFALASERGKDGTVPVAALVLAMLAPAVFTNIRIGQGYLIIFALLGAAVVWLSRQASIAGGALLGFALGLKLSGTALVLVLAAERRWRALAAAGAAALAPVLAVTPFIDKTLWFQYPDIVREFVQRPAGSVTAYQTTLSLFRRICVADPEWNPSPAASCEPLAFVAPYALVGLAALLTLLFVHRSPHARAGLAAGVALTLLALPAAAEAHFVLLGIPLLLVPMKTAEIAAIALLLVVPLEITAERFTAGWSVLLAYPRLYAAWLLWAVCLRQLITSSLHSKAQ